MLFISYIWIYFYMFIQMNKYIKENWKSGNHGNTAEMTLKIIIVKIGCSNNEYYNLLYQVVILFQHQRTQ